MSLIKHLLLGLALAAVTASVAGQCTEPEKCPEAGCSGNCACSGSVPDAVPLADRPQIVYLTFDDALTRLFHTDYFNGLFNGTFQNPNNCSITSTFFLTHRSNDYTLVHKYRAQGHEMASHSITHQTGTDYWTGLDPAGWADEIVGMKSMISTYATMPEEEIIGVRAPFLQGGGDAQYQMMTEAGFTYDSTMPSRVYGYTNMANGRWPHTFDYLSDMDCQIQPCPTCAFPGIWSQPMLELEDMRIGSNPLDPDHGAPCSMLDSCVIPDNEDNPDVVFDMLMKNFERAYNGNTRAPIGFYMHAAWFLSQAAHYEGYKRFVGAILENDDVYIVPVRAGIEYMRNPVPMDQIDTFAPFQCDNLPDDTCIQPQSCKYENVEIDGTILNEIYMASCAPCPPNYPWLGNPMGD